MTNKPKAIGTAAETAVVRYLRANGFAGAERRALAGSSDLGDVTGCGALVIEVKGGRAAEAATPPVIDRWMAETRTETRNAEADYGLLVVKRIAVSHLRAGQWWAYLDLHTVLELTGCLGPRVHDNLPNPVVRMTLADAVHLLRHAGYGDSPVEESA